MACSSAVSLVDQRGGSFHVFLSGRKFLTVVVANDVFKHGVVGAADYIDQVIEALISFRMLGTLADRQQRVKFHADQSGIEHCVLGRAGVDASAGDHDFGRGCVKALIFQLAETAAVHSVGFLGAKPSCVKILRAPSNFLIRREGCADCAVFALRVGDVIFKQIHDLRHAGLVV